jgi:hypothetical protein
MKEKGRIRKYIQKLEAEVQTDEKHPIWKQITLHCLLVEFRKSNFKKSED